MNDITITLPLSLFGDASIDEVIKGIKSFQDTAEKVKGAEDRVNNLVSMLTQWNNSIEYILDGNLNDFDRARALRQLVSETKDYMRVLKGNK